MERRARISAIVAEGSLLESKVGEAGVVRDLRPALIGTTQTARLLGVTPAQLCHWSTSFGHPRAMGDALQRRHFDRPEVHRIAAALAAGATIEQASAWEDERA